MAISNKKNNKKLVIMIILLVVLWAAIGFILYNYFFNNKKSEDQGQGGWLKMPGMADVFDLSNTNTSQITEVPKNEEVVEANGGYNTYHKLITDPRFNQFKSYGEWPIEIGAYGKPNPLEPFEGESIE